jgi:hypothetical protein
MQKVDQMQCTDPALANPRRVIIQLDVDIAKPCLWQTEYARFNGGTASQFGRTYPMRETDTASSRDSEDHCVIFI